MWKVKKAKMKKNIKELQAKRIGQNFDDTDNTSVIEK